MLVIRVRDMVRYERAVSDFELGTIQVQLPCCGVLVQARADLPVNRLHAPMNRAIMQYSAPKQVAVLHLVGGSLNIDGQFASIKTTCR